MIPGQVLPAAKWCTPCLQETCLFASAKGEKVVIAQTAPAVRVALGEEFGLPPGTITTGKMVTALKQMGFDYVFGECTRLVRLVCFPE